MTPEQREALITAISIARSAPQRAGRTYSARVPWYLIEQLRRNLEACGIDWRA
jgi:hypothetical protein